MSVGLPSSVSGFTPIPIAYSSSATHVLYVRAHSGSKNNSKKNKKSQNQSQNQNDANANGKGKAPELPEGRTLFLVNVPPDATEREISLLFKNAGTVERVVFEGDRDREEELLESDEDMDDEEERQEGEDEEVEEQQPRKKRKLSKEEKAAAAPPPVVPLPPRTNRILRRTGGTAHVIFLDASSVSRALTPPTKPKPWPVDTSTPHGLSHYTSLYNSLRPPLDIVKSHADTWMEYFEYEQEKKRQKSKYRKGEAIVDEDGFTLVTRGGAYGQTLGGGVGVASKKFQAEVGKGERGGAGGKRVRKNKKEPKEKEAFYAFQIHEKKRNELIDLKKKWEEDKAKVEKLKSSRKFKPY
ncbi:hypothetical protein K474DRAFT_1672311 [Panus rudis PR-1116 ss-1]|nr:hypothetical protein K474DRAFT_1672311 [Panus rudis PR-1116 ss-1]